MPVAGNHGKLDPHPEHTHPRVKLADHLELAAVKVPAVVDRASKVASWPMYMNGPDASIATLCPASPDGLGDCTCAGAAHGTQAFTAYGKGEFTPAPKDVLDMYVAVAGYNPQTGENDNGAVEQDVLEYLVEHGLAGHKILAYAQVDHTSPAEMKAALEIFGSLYLGIQVPSSMDAQFGAGEPLTPVAGSPIEGGHCVIVQKWDEEYIWIVTWGTLYRMTWEFFAAYGDEAWIIVTQDFLDAEGVTPDGLNLMALMAQFSQIKATPAPAPWAPEHAKPGLLRRILNWLRQVV